MSLYGKNVVPSHFDNSSILRSTERVSVTLPCRVRVDGLEYHQAEAATVISKSQGIEEAAIIVIVPGVEGAETRMPYLIPITPGLKHRLNQTPPSPSTSFFHQSSRPHITLSLEGSDSKVELRISASQTVRVQTLIADIRQLVEASKHTGPSTNFQHSWTQLYPVNPPKLDEDLEFETRAGPSGSTLDESSVSSFITPLSTSTDSQSLVTPMTSMTVESDPSNEEEQYPNPFADSFSRVHFLRKRLFAKQSDWSSPTPIKIRIATYNVNDKLPPQGTRELAPLVGSGEEDLLVFGFQEVDLRSQALLISQGSSRAEEWEAAIVRGLGAKAEEYERIAVTQYVGVMTLVFVRKSLRSAVSHVATSEKGIGLLGFGGNKAGVAVRLKIHDTTLAFVNSHLAAFAAALERRRADYQVLLKGLPFPVPNGEDIIPAFEEFYPETRDQLLGVEDCHALFWLGDLNYRIDMEEDILRAWVEDKKWSSILEKDQLRADISAGKSFTGFREHPVDFAPSFKYVHGSTTFDTRRSPAYTDRILWSTPSSAHSAPTPVECSDCSLHSILWSDHWPVSASFEVHVREVDEGRRREEYVAVERELERLEEVYRPAIEIHETNIDFGEVKVLRKTVREVRLGNNGRVPATFSFKPPALDKPICKPWFWPFPCTGTIQPGESILLKVSLLVDSLRAADLSIGNAELNDVLVLRVTDGRDTFVTLQGAFLPTILSLPLSLVNHLTTPLQALSLAERKVLANPPDDAYEEKPKGVKPVKEIWRLLEYLMEHGTNLHRLWTAQSDAMDSLAILDCLDTGADLRTAVSLDDEGASSGGGDPNHARAVAACLILLLSSLPTPLIPENKLRECEAALDRDDAFAALEGVPPPNTNVLIGLMSVVKLCLERPPDPVDKDTPDEPEQVNGEPPTPASAPADPVADDNAPLPETATPEKKAQLLPSPMADLPTPPIDSTAPTFSLTEATPKRKTSAALPGIKPLGPETLDEIVDVLLAAVFGRIPGPWRSEGQRRFVKLLLEG